MMLDDRIYIFDCMGQIVGNPKGYRTMRGAMQQSEMRKSKAYKEIMANYWKQKAIDPDTRLICRVSSSFDGINDYKLAR